MVSRTVLAFQMRIVEGKMVSTDENMKLRSENIELGKENVTLKTENMTLQAANMNLIDKNDNLVKQVNDIVAEKKGLEQKLEKQQNEIHQFKIQFVDKIKNKIALYQPLVKNRNDDISRSPTEIINDLEKSITKLQDINKKNMKEIEKARKWCKEFNNNVNSLKNALQHTCNTFDETDKYKSLSSSIREFSNLENKNVRDTFKNLFSIITTLTSSLLMKTENEIIMDPDILLDDDDTNEERTVFSSADSANIVDDLCSHFQESFLI